MAQKWFVQSNDRVDGPLTTEEIQTRLQTGQLAETHLVWTAGMEHWRNLSWWNRESAFLNSNDTGVSETAREVWHFALSGESHGPYSRELLLDKLKVLGSLGDVLLWTKGMKEWAPLFEFHDILTEIGVNKRQFPRADINGQVTIKSNEGTLIAPLLTVSEGGMGVQLDGGLTAGMSVTIEIASSAFRAPLHAKADVRYVANGVAGLRFSNISQENRGAIVSYVRQSQTKFVLKAS